MVPWQELFDVTLHVAVDNSRQRAAQIGERIDGIEFDEVDGSLFRRHSERAIAMIALTGRCHP